MLSVLYAIKNFVLENSEFCDAAITVMNGGDYYANV